MDRSGISLACIWICVLVVSVQCIPQEVFSIIGKSVTIQCPLEPKSEVMWFDFVYNKQGGIPATVYKDGVTNDDEYHTGRFSVATDTMALTISSLTEEDVGKYFCEVASGEKYEFDLSLGRMPDCQGHVIDLRPGQETTLTCTMEYAGKAPAVEWLREGEVIEKVDKTEIGLAKHVASVVVVPEMDTHKFTCRVAVGDMLEECSLTFDVKYGVQDLMIKPEKAAYAPGAEFMCSAKGNPVPKVTVTLPDGEIKMANNTVKVVIPNEWEGLTQSVLCEAKNLEDGLPKSANYNFTFTVSSKADPSTGEEAESEGDLAESTGKSTQMAGIVAGIVIGAVVLVIIIIAVVCVKKRQSKPPKGSKPVPTKEVDVNA